MPEGEGLSEEFDAQLNAVFGMGNIIERELALDKLKWDEINRFLTFEYFTLNNILATLVKASILERWSVLDRAAGMELFRKFVDEVRGTFKGINNKENINLYEDHRYSKRHHFKPRYCRSQRTCCPE